MKKGEIVTDGKKIKAILQQVKTVAVIGLSPDPGKESNVVGNYLRKHGYEVIPIYPGRDRILGQKAYGSLDELSNGGDRKADIVNVFRKSEQMLPHAQEAVRHNPRYFWMQLGIENREAAGILVEAGIDVIMNRCIKKEHEKLVK